MKDSDKVKVNELLAKLSSDIAAVTNIPGVREYIGLVLEWELRQTDHLLVTVLEHLLDE